MAVDVVIVNNYNDDVVISFCSCNIASFSIRIIAIVSKIVNNIDTTTIPTIKTSAPFL